MLNSSSDEDYELATNRISRKRIAKCFESDDSDSDNNVLVTPAKFKKVRISFALKTAIE